MSTCGEVGSDVHALIKELAIRRVEHRSDTHSNESQDLAGGTEVLRLRRRFSFCFTAGPFIPYASPSLQTGDGVCEHPTAPFLRPGVCTSVSYRGGNRARGTGRSERVGGGIGVGGGNGDGNGVGGGNGNVNGYGDGAGAGAGARTGVEVNEGAQDGDGDGSGDVAGTGTGTGVETPGRTQDGNRHGNRDGSEDSSGDGNGDEDRIGEGGREARQRKKPQNSCRRHVGNGGDLVGKRKKCRKERVGPVAAHPDNLKSYKEIRGGAQGTQGSSKNCTSRESVSPLSRLIRDFRNKYH